MSSDPTVLLRKLYPSLRRFAAVTGRHTDDPDDLVQEALTRLLQRSSLHEIDHPEAYLRSTIVNIVIDRSRRSSTRERNRHLTAVGNSHDDNYPSDLDLLDELSPLDRSIVYLVDIEGRSFRETAESVGCTVAAARLRASRARKRLRDILAGQS